MTKESKKKEDEIKEAVANCEPPQLAVTYYDRKNINIETLIRTIRGQKVMLDSDLAMLYGVTTSRLNEQVKRNNNRFPDDFMFQLTKEEWSTLKSQIAISKVSDNVAVTNLMSQIAISSWGGARKAPYAFTRNGIGMQRIVLIDNFVDDRVLSLLDKRADNVEATIHSRYSEPLQIDLKKHNEQYREIKFIQLPQKNHDRFLIIDDDVYLLGASVKDMGVGMCAVTKMQAVPEIILKLLR